MLINILQFDVQTVLYHTRLRRSYIDVITYGMHYPIRYHQTDIDQYILPAVGSSQWQYIYDWLPTRDVIFLVI